MSENHVIGTGATSLGTYLRILNGLKKLRWATSLLWGERPTSPSVLYYQGDTYVLVNTSRDRGVHGYG